MKYALLPIMALAMGGLVTTAHAMSHGGAVTAAPSAIITVAHAGAPYKNVNRQNDAGNDTGDSEVDKLNSMQLDQNYKGPTYAPGSPPPSAMPMMPPNASTMSKH